MFSIFTKRYDESPASGEMTSGLLVPSVVMARQPESRASGAIPTEQESFALPAASEAHVVP
jgi:hypothetical protein